MNETTKPTIGARVNIGGREFTLRYPVGTMREAKLEFGGSITDMRVLRQVDEDRIARLLWYGLREHHPEITETEIEALLDPTQMKDVMDSYFQALNIALPEPKNDQSPAAAIETMEKLETMLARAEMIIESMKSITSNTGQSVDSTSGSLTAKSGA